MTEQKRDKTKIRLRKARKVIRELRKGLSEPPKDKMIREPEKKKDIWEPLIIRGRDLNNGGNE